VDPLGPLGRVETLAQSFTAAGLVERADTAWVAGAVLVDLLGPLDRVEVLALGFHLPEHVQESQALADRVRRPRAQVAG